MVPVAEPELGRDHQPVVVLGQRVADVGELGLLAFALAIEPGLGVGGRSVRVVAARHGSHVRRCSHALVLSRPWRGSSSSRPTPQPACRRPRQQAAHLWFKSSARNLCATSASSSRSRFFVNTVGTHTGSSTPSPPKKRYGRL